MKCLGIESQAQLGAISRPIIITNNCGWICSSEGLPDSVGTARL